MAPLRTPTAGFLAKYYVFLAAIHAGHLWLVIVGLVTSVAALYYYAAIIRRMYFPSEQPEGGFPVARSLTVALAIAAVGVLYLGILPSAFVEWVRDAAGMLLAGR